jgi:biopolymer transport protein ExbD
MPVPRSVRIGFYFALFVVPWVLVLRFFWRFFHVPYNGLWDALESASYVPILVFFAAILIQFLRQQFCDGQNLKTVFAATGTRTKIAKWIGVALVFGGTGLVAAWCGWISTRSLLPLEESVSLSPGHIRTREFKINVPSKYLVYLELDRKRNFVELECFVGFGKECSGTPSILSVSWTISSAGRIVAEGGTKSDQRVFETQDVVGRDLGFFYIEESEQFVLDVNVLADASRLNSANPRLKVEELGGMYWEYRAQTVFMLLVCMFAVLVGSASWVQSRTPVESRPSSIETRPTSAELRNVLPIQVWIGSLLVLVSLSTFVAVYRWMASRTFVALDMPISLARGHTKTGPFKINLKDDYAVRIRTGWESYFDPNCPPYGRVKAHWVLYRDGHVVAKWLEPEPDTYLSGFYSEEGMYELDLEVLSDSACLNPGHPRLLVYTNKGDYGEYAGPTLWASGFGIALGASLVVLGLIAFSAEIHPRSTRISDFESIGQYFQWAQKLPLRKGFSSPPAFALLVAPILLLVGVVFFILGPYPHKGLYVQVLKPGPFAAAKDQLTQPVVVQLVDAGPGQLPNLYVNSKATSWDRLGSDLKNELKLRPGWVVYVEADPDLPWSDAVSVIDVAKGLHAKVVLLTSKPAIKTKHSRKAVAPKQ